MNRRSVGVLIAAALVAAMAAASIMLVPGARPLTGRATRVASTKGWQAPGMPTYHWLSDHEVLVFRAKLAGGSQSFVPLRVTLPSGQETPAGIAPLFGSLAAYGIPMRTEVSPDGKWMLWWGNGGQTYLGAIDGSRSVHWRGWQQDTLWMSDSRRAAALLDSAGSGITGAIVRSVDHSDRPVRVSIATGRVSPLRSNNPVIAPGDHLLAPVSGLGTSFQWYDVPLSGDRTPARLHAIPLPPIRERGGVWLSPRGDRFAMVAKAAPLSPAAQWLYRALRIPVPYRWGLWTGRLDGSTVHEVGYFPEPPRTAAPFLIIRDTAVPVSVRFLPDGKRLSFVYEGNLWTVPVE